MEEHTYRLSMDSHCYTWCKRTWLHWPQIQPAQATAPMTLGVGGINVAGARNVDPCHVLFHVPFHAPAQHLQRTAVSSPFWPRGGRGRGTHCTGAIAAVADANVHHQYAKKERDGRNLGSGWQGTSLVMLVVKFGTRPDYRCDEITIWPFYVLTFRFFLKKNQQREKEKGNKKDLIWCENIFVLIC